jgi:hypothetical protein
MKCMIIPEIIWITGIVTKLSKKNVEAVSGKHSMDLLQKTRNNTENTAVWNFTLERWGSLLVQRQYQYEVQFILAQALKSQTGSRGIILLFLLGSRGGGKLNATRRPFYSQEETRHPLCSRLGGHQDQPGRVRKISPHRDSIPDRPTRRVAILITPSRSTIIIIITLNSLYTGLVM